MGVRFIPSPNETTKPAAGTCPFWLSFRRPSSLALYRNFLQHKVRRVFRSLAIGYAKSERMQVQTVQQWLALTEENRRQREMHGVDQPLGLYMLGAGVPSDHLVTPTRKTDSGGKDLSCG